MTTISFLAIALGLAGVFAVFWWIVEWSGGVAGQGLSICRSMQAGFATWRDSPDERSLGASADHSIAVTTEESVAVPIERVDGGPTHRR